jgi:alkanesulfonate monooxygenase SsuD/methylene tetrahydromethanopterin reductase-like flavin-dependent oxidoreductase (luciferase family)
MRFAVFLPNFGPFGDPDALVRLALDAESSGWHGFFIWDHIQLDGAETGPIVDPWVALTAVAAATSSLRIGTMITPLARRRPWKVARETVTLDRVSGGRLTLGVGLGYPADAEFGTFGEETDDRVRAAKLDEGLDILDGLWSGKELDYDGEHFKLSGAEFQPGPVQQPRIPVWCGGWWPNRRPFRRAARWDGVAPELAPAGGTPTPSQVGEIAAYVKEHGASDPFDIAVNGYSNEGAEPEAGSIADYEAAGLTWWMERIDTERLFSFDKAQQRVHAGPPNGGEDESSPNKKGSP